MTWSTRRIGVVTALALSVGGIAFAAIVRTSPLIVFNASDSVPRGWYWVRTGSTHPVGSLVLARLPRSVALFADNRKYLPVTVPIQKRIGAVAGQEVCEVLGEVLIDGKIVARTLKHDGAGRPLPVWTGCRMLQAGEVFFLNPDHETSFDSRYFGPLNVELVIGETIPLWTW